MGIILWILFGALAGWIASIIVGRNEEQGALGNIFVGILGALIGGLIVSVLGGAGISGFNLYSIIVAIGGSTLLLWVYEAATS